MGISIIPYRTDFQVEKALGLRSLPLQIVLNIP